MEFRGIFNHVQKSFEDKEIESNGGSSKVNEALTDKDIISVVDYLTSTDEPASILDIFHELRRRGKVKMMPLEPGYEEVTDKIRMVLRSRGQYSKDIRKFAESKVNEEEGFTSGGATVANEPDTTETPEPTTPEPELKKEEPVKPEEEKEEEELPPEGEKEYLGNKGGEEYFYFVIVPAEDGTKDLQIQDADDEVVYSAKENQMDAANKEAFLMAGIKELELSNIATEIVDKYLIPEEEEIEPEAGEEQVQGETETPKESGVIPELGAPAFKSTVESKINEAGVKGQGIMQKTMWNGIPVMTARRENTVVYAEKTRVGRKTFIGWVGTDDGKKFFYVVDPPDSDQTISGGGDYKTVEQAISELKADLKAQGNLDKMFGESKVDEKAPPGEEYIVKKLKKVKNVDNPYAVAWAMRKKGAHFRKGPHAGEKMLSMGESEVNETIKTIGKAIEKLSDEDVTVTKIPKNSEYVVIDQDGDIDFYTQNEVIEMANSIPGMDEAKINEEVIQVKFVQDDPDNFRKYYKGVSNGLLYCTMAKQGMTLPQYKESGETEWYACTSEGEPIAQVKGVEIEVVNESLNKLMEKFGLNEDFVDSENWKVGDYIDQLGYVAEIGPDFVKFKDEKGNPAGTISRKTSPIPPSVQNALGVKRSKGKIYNIDMDKLYKTGDVGESMIKKLMEKYGLNENTPQFIIRNLLEKYKVLPIHEAIINGHKIIEQGEEDIFKAPKSAEELDKPAPGEVPGPEAPAPDTTVAGPEAPHVSAAAAEPAPAGAAPKAEDLSGPDSAEANIKMQYPEEPFTTTALAYADSIVNDPKVYGAIRNLKWTGAYADGETFLKQAKIVGSYNEFNPDIAQRLVDAIGEGSKFRLAREGSVAVYFTIRDPNRKISLDTLRDIVKADEADETGNPGEARLWWD